MAYVITDSCVACGTCQPVCPVDAISEGDIYHIDPDPSIEWGACAEVGPRAAISPGDDFRSKSSQNTQKRVCGISRGPFPVTYTFILPM